MQKYRWAILIAALLVTILPSEAEQQILLELTAQQIEEAIQLAGDERRARMFLDQYAAQMRAGWGNGPLIGRVSTPFSRVVQAAVAARKKGKSFSAADAVPELLSPELHVIATSQPGSMDEGMIATVTSVVLVPLGNNSNNEVVRPSKTLELTKEYQDINGTSFESPGVVAIFPLTALARTNELRVVFDRIARGSNALSTCRECVVPLSLDRIR